MEILKRTLSAFLAMTLTFSLLPMPAAATAEETESQVETVAAEPVVETLAPIAVPETSIPETTLPVVSIPATTVAETTVPETTVPETTVPETTVPETTQPEETFAEKETAEATMPAVRDGATSGKCGDNLYWTLDEDTGLLTIYGEGDMYTNLYTFSSNTSIGSVVVEEGVTSICGISSPNLTSVTIPASITSMPTFVGHEKLTGIWVDENNATYASDENGVLYNKAMTKLLCVPGALTGEFKVPDTVTSVGLEVFNSCVNLTSITLPERLSSIGYSMFSGCISLESIVLPENVTTISYSAFYGCTSLTEITIPKKVTSIGYSVFSGCSSLKTIIFKGDAPTFQPHLSTDIPNAFEGITATVYYPANNTTWTEEVRQNYGGTITWVAQEPEVIASGSCGENLTWKLDENGVLTISGEGPMDDFKSAPWWDSRKSVIRLVVEEGVTTIGSYAFYSCTAMSSMELPDSLLSIGERAFHNCWALTNVAIPKNLSSIGMNAFLGCYTLSSFSVAEDSVHYATDESGALYSKDGKTLVLCPPRLGDSYTIADGTTKIGNYAFVSCNYLTDVVIADSVETIGIGAFSSCANLTSITIPKSVNFIGSEAFADCDNLTGIWVDSDNSAFANDASGVLFTKDFTELICYPSGLTGAYTIPEGVTDIMPFAFTLHENLTGVTLPETLNSIGIYAFNKCSALTEITIAQNVESIGRNAFAGCTALSSIIFRSSAPSISDNAFLNITATAYYPGNDESWTEEVRQNYGGTITWVAVEPCEEHTWSDVEIVKDPGCTGVGEGKKTCTVCGESEPTILYGEHAWGEEVVIREVSCTQDDVFVDGETQKTCTVCGTVKTTVVASYHDFDLQVIQNATCTQPHIEQLTCKRCGKTYRYTYPGDHYWDYDSRETLAEVTCESDGEIQYTCLNCPETKTEIIPAAHLWENETVKDSTCTEDGLGQRTCSRCGKVVEYTINAAHSYEHESTIITEATCETLGLKTISCTVCSEVLGEQTLYSNHSVEDGSSICTICGKNVCGDTMSWSFDAASGTLTISGYGTMRWMNIPWTQYNNPSYVPWAAVREQIRKVVFTGDVGYIAAYAFYGCTNLTDITIPESCYSISQSAFQGCTKLAKISLPSMYSVSESAFADCTALKDVKLDSIIHFAPNAFAGCTSLEELRFGMNLTEIDSKAFSGCTGLKTITFTGNAPEIADNAFTGVTASVTYPAVDITWTEDRFQNYGGTLNWIGSEEKICGDHLTWDYNETTKTLTISGTGAMYDYDRFIAPWENLRSKVETVVVNQGVTAIGHCAFDGMTKLTSVTLPQSVTFLGDAAFRGCTSLASIDLPDNLEGIGAYAFESCTALKSVEIPGTVTNIAYYTFTSCTSLQSVKLPENPEAIELAWGMFSNCSSLTEVNLEHLTTIPMAMFMGCSGLTTVTFPKSLHEIAPQAFQGCTNLKSLYFTGNAFFAVEQDPDTFKGVTADAYYPADNDTWDATTLRDYGGTINWVPYDSNPSGKCGENLTWVFDDETGTLTISGTGEMDSYPEYNQPWALYKDSIQSLIVEEGVTSIGVCAFEFYDKLTSVSFPSTLKKVLTQAFQGTGLTQLRLPSGLTYLGDAAFAECKNLTDLTMPFTPEWLGMTVFTGCTSLSTVDISQMSFPDGLSAVGGMYYMFSDCDALTNLDFLTTVDTISGGMFADCDGLTSLTIPDHIRGIDESAFARCANLTEVTIPASVEDMYGYFIFSDCTKLEAIHFLGNAPEFSDLTFHNLTTTVYYPAKDATWNNVAGKDYGGDITWVPSPSAVELRSENDLTYIRSGKTLRLTAYRPDGEKLSVSWAITAGNTYASVSSSGLVTAKTVEEIQAVTVTATDKETGVQSSITLQILPNNTALTLMLDGEALGAAMDVDKKDISSMTLTAQLEGVTDPVLTWSSSSKTVATVEEGVVTLLKPGTVTITAKDTYGISGSVKLNVYYLDTAKKLTASAEIPDIGLQPGETAKMLVFGTNALSAEDLIFTSSNQEMATVDDSGFITGGEKTGTVRITAAMKDDPLNRKVTLSVKIIPVQTKSLTLYMDEKPQTAVSFDKADLNGESFTFLLTPEALDSEGQTMKLTNQSIQWTSSDTRLATVTTNTDGSAEVTIKAGADGVTVITAQTKDLAKVSASLTLTVMDRSPRLGSSTVTLDPMQNTGAEILLVSSYGNTIREVSLPETSGLGAEYDPDTSTLTIQSLSETMPKNATIKTVLDVTCRDEDGKETGYSFDLKVTIKNVIPSVTVKQTEKMNLFYIDSTAGFTVTAKDAEVSSLELDETTTADFCMDEEGVLCFSETFQDKLLENPKLKPDTSATLLIYLEGYAYPVEKNITISTATTKPKVVLSAASSVINTAIGNPSTGFTVYDSQTGTLLHDAIRNVTMSLNKTKEDFAVCNIFGLDTPEIFDDVVTLTLNGTEGGTATLEVQADNWTQSVKVTHKVTVQTKLPTVKVDTLELNNIFSWREASAYPALSQGNAILYSIEDITPKSNGAEKLDVWYEDGYLHAKILEEYQDQTLAPKAGTYSFQVTPVLYNGADDTLALNPITVKVKVSAAVPTVKLGTSSVKMNRNLAPNETGTVEVKVTNDYGFQLTGFTGLRQWEDKGVYLTFDPDAGQLKVTLDEDTAVGKYAYTLYPEFQQPDSNEHTAQLPKAISLTVQVYDGKAPTVTQSAKGKLDAIDPTSEIVYTISKISNALGKVTGVTLEKGSEWFKISELYEVNGKQCFKLTLKDTVTYSTKVSYDVQFTYSICGAEVKSAVLKIKVSQSTLKITAPTVQYYLSQTADMRIKVSLTAPVNAQMAQITLNTDKTSKELAAVIGAMEPVWSDNCQEVLLYFPVQGSGELKDGRSYKLVLDILPAGHAADAKATQISITVKVSK